jgi:hypothetical protein
MSSIKDAVAMRRDRRRRRKSAGREVAEDAAESAFCCCIVDELFDPCFVATAAHGSAEAPQVLTLRRYRDEVLLTHLPGRLFISAYYRLGPYGARFLRGKPQLKRVTREALEPVVRYAERKLG